MCMCLQLCLTRQIQTLCERHGNCYIMYSTWMGWLTSNCNQTAQILFYSRDGWIGSLYFWAPCTSLLHLLEPEEFQNNGKLPFETIEFETLKMHNQAQIWSVKRRTVKATSGACVSSLWALFHPLSCAAGCARLMLIWHMRCKHCAWGMRFGQTSDFHSFFYTQLFFSRCSHLLLSCPLTMLR